MPLEKLKAIMEKKKSEAYKAMLRSQGKMEEETELDEKKLTSAEMKKREEVAKAIERDQPEMPMGKKMAIATATAKKVAEELVGNQHKIDANKNNKIDAHDFKLLRAKKKTMKEFVEQLAESLSSKAE
jgi:very-short-patch-repair endonuclease